MKTYYVWLTILLSMRAICTATPGDQVAARPQPMFIAHRGDMNAFPEHTMEAYRRSLADGAKFLELDCWLLDDGTIGIMHDETLDRTTMRSWPTSKMNESSWKDLRIEGAKLIPRRTETFPAPTLADVIAEYRGRAIFVIEPKNGGSGAAIVGLLRRMNVSAEAVLFNSFIRDELTEPRKAGYRVILNLGNELNSPNAEQLRREGWNAIAVGAHFSEQYIGALVDAGIDVFAYTVNRYFAAERLIGLGVKGIFSDNSAYLARSYRSRAQGIREKQVVRDQFAQQTWPQVFLPTRPGNLGYWIPPDKWAIYQFDNNVYAGVLQGWAPLLDSGPQGAFSISLSVSIGRTWSADRWAGVLLASEDRVFLEGGDRNMPTHGYHFLACRDGKLRVYQYDGAGPIFVKESEGRLSLSPGQEVQYEITRRGSTLEFRVARGGPAVKIFDGVFKARYMTLGAKGADVEFSKIQIIVE